MPRRQRRGKDPRVPRRSSKVPVLDRDLPLSDAAIAIAVPAVAKADASWNAVIDDPSPEHVHDFRVAVRQLRVVLHIFRKQDASGELRAVRDALKHVASAVGRKRDVDVMIAEIVQPLLDDADGEDVHSLVGPLERQRLAAKAEVSRVFGEGTVAALRDRLAALPDQLAVAAMADDGSLTVAKFAQRDLRKRWRRLETMAENLDRLSAPELHEMRKMIKKLRYAFGHFAPLFDDKHGSRFNKALQRLQDAFGYLNDVASARKAGERLKSERADAVLAYAAGYVLGRHVERARDVRRRIGKNWERLAGTELARSLGEK